MANKLKVGLLAGVGIGGFWLYSKIQAIGRLSFAVGSPQNIRVDFKGGFLKWVQNITVLNGADTSLVINTTSLDLIANGSYLGKAILLEPQTIQATSESIIQVSVTCGLIDLATAIPDAIVSFTKNRKEVFQMVGTVSGYGATVQINQDFTFDFSKIL